MKSDLCRKIDCPYFGKFSGKAACYFTAPKKLVKHLEDCPAVI